LNACLYYLSRGEGQGSFATKPTTTISTHIALHGATQAEVENAVSFFAHNDEDLKEQEFVGGEDAEIAMACKMGMLENEEVADGDIDGVPKERGENDDMGIGIV